MPEWLKYVLLVLFGWLVMPKLYVTIQGFMPVGA